MLSSSSLGGLCCPLQLSGAQESQLHQVKLRISTPLDKLNSDLTQSIKVCRFDFYFITTATLSIELIVLMQKIGERHGKFSVDISKNFKYLSILIDECSGKQLKWKSISISKCMHQNSKNGIKRPDVTNFSSPCFLDLGCKMEIRPPIYLSLVLNINIKRRAEF